MKKIIFWILLTVNLVAGVLVLLQVRGHVPRQISPADVMGMPIETVIARYGPPERIHDSYGPKSADDMLFFDYRQKDNLLEVIFLDGRVFQAFNISEDGTMP